MRVAVLLTAVLLIVCPRFVAASSVDSVLVVPRGDIISGPSACHECFETGDEFLFIGVVTHVGAPLVLPTDPAEYTMRIYNAVCQQVGLWDDPQTDRGGVLAMLGPSIVEIYRDTSPDADPGNPETFWDGELVLYANVDEQVLYFDDGGYPPGPPAKLKTDLRLSGGMWFDRVSKDGVGYAGVIGITSGYDYNPAVLTERTIMGHFGAVVSVDAPVATEGTTWGRLKTLYE